MRRFTIQCNFNGNLHPFDVYIGNPKGGSHPLQNQASWLSRERGGQIPPEVMESFAKLLELAEKENVSFEDLCAYALNHAQKEGAEGDSGQAPGMPELPQTAVTQEVPETPVQTAPPAPPRADTPEIPPLPAVAQPNGRAEEKKPPEPPAASKPAPNPFSSDD